MEIGENENEENTTTKKKSQPLHQQLASSTSSTLHSTQSQPIIAGGGDEDDCAELRTTKKKENEKLLQAATARRVSFANSSQLAQYLEPINPFESFGECGWNLKLFSARCTDVTTLFLRISASSFQLCIFIFSHPNRKFERAFESLSTFVRETQNKTNSHNTRTSGVSQPWEVVKRSNRSAELKAAFAHAWFLWGTRGAV